MLNYLISLKSFLVFFFFFFFIVAFAQSNFQITSSYTDQECEKGSASIIISGTSSSDSIKIIWSSGQEGVKELLKLDSGIYSVYISITNTTTFKDTVVNFNIKKVECVALASIYFSPNGDGYNDVLNIANVNKFPNFELFIYNRWGQQVHTQKNVYTPWDGTYNGLPMPDGTYYYVFFYDSSNKNYFVKLFTTILR